MPAKRGQNWKAILLQMGDEPPAPPRLPPTFGKTLQFKGYRSSTHNTPSTVKDFNLDDVLRMLEENRKARRPRGGKVPLKGIFGGG